MKMLYTLLILLFMFIYHTITIEKINSLNRETQVHWMLPSDAKCAVKLLWFRDAKGEKYPANMMVCNFDAALKQPIRPKPKQNLEIMQEKYRGEK